MEYNVIDDMHSVLELRGLSMDDFAKDIGVSRITVSNWFNRRTQISEKHISLFYNYAYEKGIRLNRIKEQLYRESRIDPDTILLFHGAKASITGKLALNKNKGTNDFGNGFYCGETLNQAAMFASPYSKSSLYMLLLDPSSLKCKKYDVENDWMLAIAYFRGRLEEYKESKIIKNIIKSHQKIDYIIAPIADNRMYEIIDSFIDGEITDIQCKHCLSATNLGMQYVFVSPKALGHITLLEKCFLADLEKQSYLSERNQNYEINMDKVKMAKKQYRNQGKYIEELLV